MPQETDRPTGVRWVVAGLLGVAGTIAYLDRIVIANVVIELREELDLSVWQAGWVLTSFLIGYGLMQVPMGRLGDVRGIRFALPTIVLLWSLMTGLTPLVQSFAILLSVRIMFGMAQAGVFPLTVPGIRRWFPLESRTKGQGLVISCSAVSHNILDFSARVLNTFARDIAIHFQREWRRVTMFA